MDELGDKVKNDEYTQSTSIFSPHPPQHKRCEINMCKQCCGSGSIWTGSDL
jgi:hypothetical protein